MIAAKIDLYGMENTVTRPISIIMAGAVKELMNIAKDVPTVFDGNDPIFRTMDSRGEVKGMNTTLQEQMEVTFTDNPEDGAELNLTHLRPDKQPIFADDSIDACIIPMYQNRKIIMEVKYYNKSQSKIMAIINRLRIYLATDEHYIRRDLEYNYVIPNYVCKLIMKMNELKNNVDIPKIELEDYLVNSCDQRLTLNYPEDGRFENTYLAIREVQCDVQAWLSDDLASINSEEDKDKKMHLITLNFEFYYEKPIGLYLKYPILVYNQFLGKEFIKTVPRYTTPNPKAIRPYGGGAISMFGNPQSALTTLPGMGYLTLPKYDRMNLPDNNRSLVRMLSVLVIVDPLNKRFLFNLYDMDDEIKFTDDIIKFLCESEGEFVSEFRKSIFYVELYKNKQIDPTNKVKILRNGDVVTTEDMDLRATYRVVFNILIDLDMLTADAKRRIKEYLASIAVDSKTVDNISSAYITILNIPENKIKAAMEEAKTTTDVIFKLTDISSEPFKTRQTTMIYSAMLEEVNNASVQ